MTIYVICDLRVAPKEASVSVVSALVSEADALAAAAKLAENNNMPNRVFTYHKVKLETSAVEREETRDSIMMAIKADRSAIADWIESCREGGNMKHVVQVFDVLAKRIRNGEHLPPLPEVEGQKR